MLQLWPQYRVLKILLKIFKGDPSYVDDKSTLERDVFILEPFLESVPTVWITAAILGLLDDSGNRYALGENSGIIIISFTFSVIIGNFEFFHLWVIFAS